MVADLEGNMENGWREWSKHVLKELERLNDCYIAVDNSLDNKIEKVNKSINGLRVDIARLKVKSGIWGAIGAAIPILITLAIMAIRSQV